MPVEAPDMSLVQMPKTALGTVQLTPQEASESSYLASQGPFPQGSLILAGSPDPDMAGPQDASAPWMKAMQDWESQHRLAGALREAQGAGAGLPIAQAHQAIAMASKFVASRGYQQDLASNMPADQALAKWGPMLFADHAAALGPAIKSVTPTTPPEAHVLTDPTTGHQTWVGTAGGRQTLHPINERPGVGGRELTDAERLRGLQLEQARLGASGFRVPEGVSPKRRKEIEDSKTQYDENEKLINELLRSAKKGTKVQSPAGTSTTSTAAKGRGKPFKDPSGKIWLYSGTAKNPLTDTTAENWQEAP
jgi:hypothetical protein